MRAHLSLWLCSALSAFATVALPQTPPCLDGIINDYAPVLGFGCDSSTLQVGTLNGFAAGDKVLLLQMQVPQVDLSNTASFGALLNATCIGNFEFNRIQSLGGNTIQLQFALTRPYDVSGKVQLVRVPEYDSVTVCNLSCQPWNGSTGGVLALDVKYQLTLADDLDVSGKGFRGGIVEQNIIPWVFGEMQYFYSPQSTLAAEKGEGIVLIPVDQSYGRGRAGNGGGGGNAHNGGGGGGANAGAGGGGGLEITNLPASPSPNTNGIAGQQYFDTNPNKILLGGGGGAGHANDSRGTSGGAGGGIVLILANSIQTNNFRVLANGVDVFGGQEQNDGQGGGGGGGTVVLAAGQINGILNCELKGGRGGSNPYTPAFQLHGPGGGGGGGKLLLTQNTPNVVPALQGGINGLSSQNFTNGAQPGQAGKLLSNFALPAGFLPAHPVSNNMVLAVQSPLCAGLANGQIAVLQSTALAFRLNGGSWQADSLFTGLVPGVYSIGLLFSGGCSLDTMAVLIAAPPVLDSLLALTDASCTTGGSISVAAVSGTPPFEFQVNGAAWQASGNFAALSPGDYTVTLRDAAGCTKTSTYQVAAPPPPLDSLLSLIDATCLAGGEIAVAALAGTPPFEFQINGGAWQTSGNFAGLPPGDYTVTLRDAAGCTKTNTYEVAAPPPPLDSLLVRSDATCLAGGEIAVVAVAGTAPFEFQINGGAWQAGGNFAGLPPGDYTVTLRDAAGCTKTNTYEVAAPPPPLDSLLVLSDATCLAGGEIAVVAVAGTPPFEFQINGGAWQAGGNFAALPPGDYTVTLRDAAGCTKTNTYEVAAPPPPLDSLLVLSDATCLAGGEIAVVAVAGTPPFEFQINGGAWQAGGNFAGLPPGDYMITLRDAAGCTITSTYAVAAPPPPLDSLIALSDATCLAGGEIAVVAVAGTAPFEFQINGGSWQAGGNFAGLPPGDYMITLRDAAGCTNTSLFQVAAPPPVLDSLLTLIDATCLAGGEIAVAAVSGTAPFEFQINGAAWQAGGNFAGLSPGDYTVTLRDAAGCTNTSLFQVAAPPPVLDSLLTLIDATCLAGGEIAVAALAGTPPFEFQINGEAWQAGGNFTGLSPGDYTITLRDAAGCTNTSLFQVAAPPPVLDSLLTLIDATCLAGGEIAVAALAGTPPFEFQINGEAWQAGGNFAGLQPGDYTVTLRDAAGCTKTSLFQVAAPPLPQDSLLSLTDAGCLAGGTLSVSGISGTPPFQFQIDGGPWQSGGSFADLPPGDYLLTLLDAAGCAHSSLYAIAPYPPMLLALDSLGVVDCRHGLGFMALSVTGGSAPYSYRLEPGGGSQPGGYFPDLEAGLYALVVTDAVGCTVQLEGLEVPDLIDTSLTHETVTIYEGTKFQLPDGSSTARPGQYSFAYETVEGCDSLHVIDLIVLKRHVYVPNVFQPDGLELNSFFTVFSDESLSVVRRLAVYDRWGELIFENQHLLPNQADGAWDGRFRGRPVGAGVYAWMADLEFVDGVKMLLWGDVTVLR